MIKNKLLVNLGICLLTMLLAYTSAYADKLIDKSSVEKIVNPKKYTVDFLMEKFAWGETVKKMINDSPMLKKQDIYNEEYRKKLLSEIQPYFYGFRGMEYTVVNGSFELDPQRGLFLNITGCYNKEDDASKCDSYKFIFEGLFAGHEYLDLNASWFYSPIPEGIEKVCMALMMKNEKILPFLKKKNLASQDYSILPVWSMLPAWKNKYQKELILFHAQEDACRNEPDDAGQYPFVSLEVMIDPWKKSIEEYKFENSTAICDFPQQDIFIEKKQVPKGTGQ